MTAKGDNELLMTTEAAKAELYRALSTYMGWDFCEDEETFDHVSDQVEYHVVFHSSRFNDRDYISDINGEFRIVIGGKLVATYSVRPDDKFWFDISTHAKLLQVIAAIEGKFDDYMQPVVQAFAGSIEEGMAYLQRADKRAVYQMEE